MFKGKLKKYLSLLLALIMVFSTFSFTVSVYADKEENLGRINQNKEKDKKDNNLIIGFVYFAVDSSSAGTHSFVELYNTTDEEITLTNNYSLQYQSTDPEKTPDWEKLDLIGKIPAGHSFLVNMGEASGSEGGSGTKGRLDLSDKAFDQDFGLPLTKFHAKGVKLVIMANQTKLENTLKNPFTGDGEGQIKDYVDMFGVSGNDNPPTVPTQQIDGYETECILQGESNAQSKQKGFVRLNADRIRYIDTDNNLADFHMVDFRSSNLENPLYMPRCLEDGKWEDVDAEVPEYIQTGSENTLWINSSDLIASDLSAIEWWQDKDSKYYFFLPSTANLENVTVWHTFKDEVKINDTVINSGEKTKAFSNTEEKEFTLTSGGKSYKIVIMQADKLPAMFITIEGNLSQIHDDKDLKIPGKMMIAEKGKVVADYNSDLDHFKGRGNTSWTFDKRPYNIKLPKASSLLGIDPSKKWSLLAVHSEPSIFRHKIMHDLADEVNIKFAPHSTYIDLVVNGQYLGIYQLIERADLGKDYLVKITDLSKNTEKVNDKPLDDYPRFGPNDPVVDSYKGYEIPNDPEDITGGYLVEYDDYRYYSEDSGFVTKNGQRATLKSPEEASSRQVQYIKGFVEEMEDAIYAEDGYNSKGKYYTDYIDIESAAKYYILQELAMNVDSGRNSCYMWKDSDITGDGKIHSGPTWDWDAGLGFLGTQHGVNLSDPYSWWANQNRRISDGERTIYSALCLHNDFQTEVLKQWEETVYPKILILLGESESTGNSSLQNLDDYANDVKASYINNQKRWGRGSLEHGVNQLKNFIGRRVDYFNVSGFTEANYQNKSGAKKELEEMTNNLALYRLNENQQNNFKKDKEKYIKKIESAVSMAEITTVLYDYEYYINHFFTEVHNGKSEITVYYDNSESNWRTPYYYTWGEKGEEASWPGKPMTLTSNNIWKVTVPTGNTRIIFSDNGKRQLPTQDIREYDNLMFTKNGPGYQSTVSGRDNVWRSYTNTDVGLKEAVAQFSNELNNFVLNLNFNDYTEEEVKNIKESLSTSLNSLNGAKLVSEAQAIKDNAKADLVSKTKRIVYYDNSATKWEKVNYHIWNPGTGESTQWPGEEMTHLEGDLYTAVIPAGYNDILYTNGDGEQTVDLNIPLYGNQIHKVLENSPILNEGKYECAAVWYEYVEEPELPVDFTGLIGDVDLSGSISITDATLIQKSLAEITKLNYEQSVLAVTTKKDNSENSIDFTIKDATELQKWLAMIDANEYIGTEKTFEIIE